MRPLAHSIATAALLVGAACDSTPRGRDASAGSQKIAEVAVRFEVAGDAAPSVSMLAYQAAISGSGTDDILSVVDPLTAPAPEGYCSRRDVAGPARALGAAGGKVELEALAGWRLDLGDGRALDASPRVFPDIASVVGGVVAELGPIGLRSASRGLGLAGDEGLPSDSAVPTWTWPAGLALIDAGGGRVGLNPPRPIPLIGPQGTLLPANSTISISLAATATGDLVFGLVGAGEATGPAALRRAAAVRRHLGAVVPGRDRAASRDYVVVPAAELGRLAGRGFRSRSKRSRARAVDSSRDGGAPVRLTLEVRASSVVELRP